MGAYWKKLVVISRIHLYVVLRMLMPAQAAGRGCVRCNLAMQQVQPRNHAAWDLYVSTEQNTRIETQCMISREVHPCFMANCRDVSPCATVYHIHQPAKGTDRNGRHLERRRQLMQTNLCLSLLTTASSCIAVVFHGYTADTSITTSCRVLTSPASAQHPAAQGNQAQRDSRH